MAFTAQAEWEKEQERRDDEARERKEQEELRKEAEELAEKQKEWRPEAINAEQLLLFA